MGAAAGLWLGSASRRFAEGLFAFCDFEVGRFCTAGCSSGAAVVGVGAAAGVGASWASTPRAMRNITRITMAAAATRIPTAHSTIDHHDGRCRGRGLLLAAGGRAAGGLATTTAAGGEAAARWDIAGTATATGT
ncbi:MAG TPA: hypothetical protein PK598_04490 [Thermoanaerobaculia bacterium]|nr:hypothetical protein [Thermoanaerobaculia bacterium]